MDLIDLGWNDYFEKQLKMLHHSGLIPARVVRVEKDRYTAYHEDKMYQGVLSGKFRFQAKEVTDFPTVGDWVVLKKPSAGIGLIETVLPRKNLLARKAKGVLSHEQMISANIDYALIFSALDNNFNLNRIERYLILCAESRIEPICVFNKADLCTSLDEMKKKIERLDPQVKRFFISVLEGRGIDDLFPFLSRGKTSVLLGSSGVGKTSFVNYLVPDHAEKTQEVRESDQRGRHTTTRRDMVFLPQGGLLIDNPGMREIQLWAEDETVQDSFSDIALLEENCRFRNCTHTTEPNCAVKEAIQNGKLQEERYENFSKMKAEVRSLSVRRKSNHR